MEVDIACAGFGPAMGGFLTTLTQAWTENPADPAFESKVTPGMPLQVLCYERADDIASGVSGVVTRAQGIRASFPDARTRPKFPWPPRSSRSGSSICSTPSAPAGARSLLRLGDFFLRLADSACRRQRSGLRAALDARLPAQARRPGALHRPVQPVGRLATDGQRPGADLAGHARSAGAALLRRQDVEGLRLADQGVDKSGAPADGFMAGMDVRAQLTVVGDGPVGAVGQALDEKLGLPEGHAHREWALGMKFVIELPEDSDARARHRLAQLRLSRAGDLRLPLRASRAPRLGRHLRSLLDERPCAHRLSLPAALHPAPALWKYLKDGTLRSWGAKSLEESGKHGEPFLCGDGFARIGEGSGSTNMLTGSGVDEAWATGTQLGEAVIELLRAGKPFTQENLAATYEARRRASWVERGAHEAENARNGFQDGIVKGMIGMALAGLTGGKLSLERAHPSGAQADSSFRSRIA